MIVTDVQIKTAKTQKHLYCPVFTKDEALQTVRLQGFSCICKGKRGFESPRYGSGITGNGKENIGFGNSKCL